jgi:DNA processing protein
MTPTPTTLELLTLTMTPGLGPVLIGRAIGQLGSAQAVLEASPERLKTIHGFGPKVISRMFAERSKARAAAEREVDTAQRLGVHLLGLEDPGYPALLRQIGDAPPVLYIRGQLDPAQRDRYPVGIVGSRQCTPYGLEQAERFAAHLAGAGLTIVSGGARGIDAAAHRAALRVGGRTIVVLGCGLSHCYPEEHRALFDQIVGSDAGSRGCLISELPFHAPPAAENFPARNRIISGLSLGVIVIEAGKGSGALITARLAAEDHGREVFAVPGRVDSPASEGTLGLLKAGGASLATSPQDVLDELHQPARHLHHGTHQARYAPAAQSQADLFVEPTSPPVTPSTSAVPLRLLGLNDRQQRIIEVLDEPRTPDDLGRVLGVDQSNLRADLTVLELRRLIRRSGTWIERTSPGA